MNIEELQAQNQRLAECVMELADELLKAKGAEAHAKIEELIEGAGLEVCCWCREAGWEPSCYIKRESEMSEARDSELGGGLCRECNESAEREVAK
jgi:hypothetical protein